MVVHNIIDSTQQIICPIIGITEYLIVQAIGEISGNKSRCDITTLEDLGFSNNVIRMAGGFFTGMFIEWGSKIPFVPVDATVNACGVSVYECDEITSKRLFCERISNAKNKLESLKIKDNFNVGNHFISYCSDVYGKHYLVIHASDNSFKYGEKGLYPEPGCWYWNDLQTYRFQKRYLRYLCGEIVNTFYDYYQQAEMNNPKRNDLMAELILDGMRCDKVLYTPHYGMPSKNSIAIGCQWKKGEKVLLTRRGQDIFIIDDDNQQQDLFPHGFGVRLNGEARSLLLENQQLCINSMQVGSNVKMLESHIVCERFLDENIDEEFIRGFLKGREFIVKKQLKQVYSYSRHGIDEFGIREA